MTNTLSEQAYWELVQQTKETDLLAVLNQGARDSDITWKYPSRLGQGFVREISLRDGLELAIADYQLHDDIISKSSDFEHPLEYTFDIPDNHQTSADAIPYHLYGSGISPGELRKQFAKQRIMWVSVHIEPEVFQSFAANPAGQVPAALQHLIGNLNQEYYVRPGQATPAMHIALQQILHCPYQGFTQRMFLESKVWELMSLLLEQEVETQQGKQPLTCLKLDDIDRIHQAKAILLQHLRNLADTQPSSLSSSCSAALRFRGISGLTSCMARYSPSSSSASSNRR